MREAFKEFGEKINEIIDHVIDKAYEKGKEVALSTYKAEFRAEIEKGFDSFLLQDWSGEDEVYEEIKRLKTDILSKLT